MPASTSSRTARSRWSGGAVPGSSELPATLVDGRHADVDGAARLCRSPARRSRSRTTIGPFVMIPNGFRRSHQRFNRAARELDSAPRSADSSRWRCRWPRSRRSMTAGRSSPPQHFDEVRLHENHRRELVVGVHLELRVITPRVAVVAPVGAAAVGVQRPLERHPVDAVERRAARDFLVARRVGTTLGFGERSRSPFPDRDGHVAGRGPDAPIKQKRMDRHDAGIRLLFAHHASRRTPVSSAPGVLPRLRGRRVLPLRRMMDAVVSGLLSARRAGGHARRVTGAVVNHPLRGGFGHRRNRRHGGERQDQRFQQLPDHLQSSKEPNSAGD